MRDESQKGLLRVAVQKSGRLGQKSHDLLRSAGIAFEARAQQLLCRAENYPLEILFVRDDDIPAYVADGVCDIGIVGLNVCAEVEQSGELGAKPFSVVRELGFGGCHLALAVPKTASYQGLADLAGARIATSYPKILKSFLAERGIQAKIVEISGSVEVTPAIGVADCVCDLVSTGATLASNGLKEVETVLKSQAVLIQHNEKLPPTQHQLLERLLVRLDGVLKAKRSRYIMMNAKKDRLKEIIELIPGMETPTVVPIGGREDMVAVHAVAHEHVFWETMEQLKEKGASSILVVPIEKIIE